MIKRAHLIANLKSGKGAAALLPELAQKICDELGYQLVVHPTEGRETWDGVIAQAVSTASAPDEDSVVLAAGGDGTIRSVAQFAAGTPVRFGAIPMGTFNFFARNHSIPEVPEEALRVALSGKVEKVNLGRVNDQYFLVNASLGVYAQAIADREANTKKFGRRRLVVIISTLRSWFSKPRLLNIRVDREGKEIDLITPTVFFGNNTLQLRNLNFQAARCTDADALAMVAPKPGNRWSTIWAIIRRRFGFKVVDDPMQSFCVRKANVESNRESHEVALDGELFHMQTPLRVELAKNVLNLVVPHGMKA